MYLRIIKYILFIFLFYQSPLYSKSSTLNDFNSKNLSKYFSAIIALENKNNTEALDFFNSSKILIKNHNPYLKKYVYSLVLENKVSDAIYIIKKNINKKNSNFFDAKLLLVLDSLKKNKFEEAYIYLTKGEDFSQNSKFNSAIIEILRQYVYVFKEKKLVKDKKNFGQLSLISEAFQRCYLNDDNTRTFFNDLFSSSSEDYTRYVYFYLSYLIENDRYEEAKKVVKGINYINTTLLLSQGKSWIEKEKPRKINEFFSCRNHNDLISEFLFLVSNLYSSQDNFKKSNFYLNLSNYLNPKFVFNLSLVVENQYLNNEFKKAKKTLKNFKKEHDFYYWYRIKKEANIILKQRNKTEALNYITSKFEKIEKPNEKILFDIANFYRNLKEYEKAIEHYTELLSLIENDADIKSELLYRRGGSYERIGDYKRADIDLSNSLEINPDDAYVLNYLAYSWLERNYNIEKAIQMLEKAYALTKDDPYIIDSIGWAYFLTNDYLKAEQYLKRAVELMPEDPIVNDHYGDILWKLDRKIQARYFWKNVLAMEDAEDEMLKKINIKMINGLKDS